jgi:hypothetical protein
LAGNWQRRVIWNLGRSQECEWWFSLPLDTWICVLWD